MVQSTFGYCVPPWMRLVLSKISSEKSTKEENNFIEKLRGFRASGNWRADRKGEKYIRISDEFVVEFNDSTKEFLYDKI